ALLTPLCNFPDMGGHWLCRGICPNNPRDRSTRRQTDGEFIRNRWRLFRDVPKVDQQTDEIEGLVREWRTKIADDKKRPKLEPSSVGNENFAEVDNENKALP
ncbi:hypothetical protein PENTCL1PPCAC_5518, partial [Pristionchus entomophagus]